MKFILPSPRVRVFGAAIVLLAAVCAILAFLQYRWIGQIADAEQERLHQGLQRNLNLVRRDFNSQIAEACSALLPTAVEVEQQGRDKAYLDRYLRAGEPTQKFFSRVALAVPERGELELFVLDTRQSIFRKAEWPLGWAKLREGLSARLSGGPPTPEQYRPEGVIEFPRFGGRPDSGESDRRLGEQEWLIVELDQNYLRSVVLPSLLQQYLAESGQPQYGVIVSETADPWREVYRWGPKTFEQNNRADASVTLFELELNPFRGVRGPTGGRGLSNSAQPTPAEPPGSPPPGHGIWTLRVNHPAGGLESIVARARRRNLFLAAGLLSLLIATVIALIRFTRGAEKLAEMQMNFVSGISHELRTPLSVIRAAGFNVRTKFAGQPEQVERYGKLIQDESEKLTALVEQILHYGSASSGRILGPRELVEVQPLLEQSLPGTRESLAEAGIAVEENIESGLPLIKADRESLKHALRNLLENAVKHGNKERASVRIIAERAVLFGRPAVRIGIQDDGPGIPSEEHERVFEPFFRGKRAMENQVHGTGLGLNLAKHIIEAHGGTLVLRSEPRKGTEFVATLPAAGQNETSE
jgi:signal transduction histidine kinase